ncbi:MAG: SusF/SusE family outer membrane protein [Prevotella sp.]
MNKIMLKLGSAFTLLALMAFTLTSCEKDIDSNPTFKANTTGFKLNVPANAANNTYDLVSSTGLNLTCSQPDFGGFPLVVDYHVQVSLKESFDSFKELDTFFSTANMSVDATELNNAMIELYTAEMGDVEYPKETRALYVRLRAVVEGQNLGEVFSNVICLPSVLATYVPPTLELPTAAYICGSSIGDAWSTWKALAPVYGMAGEFYTMLYAPDGAEFKWGEWEQDWRGYGRVTDFDDQAGAGISGEGDSNIKIANGGWYVLYITTELGTNDVKWHFHILPAKAYVIGNATGDWTDSNPAWEMTPSANAATPWESPAFTASGELRAYIKVGSIDWWRTEFTLFKGGLFWRTMDIPANWAENVGEAYSAPCAPGQKLYVNFDRNTGEVK